MAGIQASGVGSGLDISSLVSQLVAAERAPLDARISREQSKATVQISALSAIKNAVSTVRDGLASLRTAGTVGVRTASTSDKDYLTATADSTVPAGTFDVEIVRLATAHKLASDPFVGGRTSVVGTGTLTLTVGTASFDVTIDDGNDTLAGIRDAINNASGNTGVTASLINETGGTRLVLTSKSTGAANTIKVTQAGGDGGLAALVYDPDVPASNKLTQKVEAFDAIVNVNGYETISASNTVTKAVDGLTLNLLQADEGTEYTVTVANDTGGAANKVKNIVASFNSLLGVLKGMQAYNPSTKVAGSMLGDAYVRGFEQQMRHEVGDPVAGLTGAYQTLASIGIKTDSSGTLVVDDAKLTAALTADFDGVDKLFTSADGLVNRVYKHMDAELATSAQLYTRSDSLNAKVKSLTKEKDKVDARMDAVEARYLKQFTALDTLLSQMKTTSNYLAQQLGTTSSG